jgi:hypothetical protein
MPKTVGVYDRHALSHLPAKHANGSSGSPGKRGINAGIA